MTALGANGTAYISSYDISANRIGNLVAGVTRAQEWARMVVVYDGVNATSYINGQAVKTAPWSMYPYAEVKLGHNYGWMYGYFTAGAPGLAIPFLRPYALFAADVAAEDARWKAALDAVTLPSG